MAQFLFKDAAKAASKDVKDFKVKEAAAKEELATLNAEQQQQTKEITRLQFQIKVHTSHFWKHFCKGIPVCKMGSNSSSGSYMLSFELSTNPIRFMPLSMTKIASNEFKSQKEKQVVAINIKSGKDKLSLSKYILESTEQAIEDVCWFYLCENFLHLNR